HVEGVGVVEAEVARACGHAAMMPEGGRMPRYEDVARNRSFCRSGGSRESLLPPLRRQGRVGEGCLPDHCEPWKPPPSLPLPPQGRGQGKSSRLPPLLQGAARSDSCCAIIPVPRGSSTPALFSRICPCCAGFRPHDAASRSEPSPACPSQRQRKTSPCACPTSASTGGRGRSCPGSTWKCRAAASPRCWGR